MKIRQIIFISVDHDLYPILCHFYPSHRYLNHIIISFIHCGMQVTIITFLTDVLISRLRKLCKKNCELLSLLANLVAGIGQISMSSGTLK